MHKLCALVLFVYGTAVSADTTALQADSVPAINSHTPLTDDTVAVTQDRSNDLELERMVVTANRRQQLLEKTQSFSVIRPDEWEGTTKSVADVIAEQTGIQTRRYGGAGSFQSISIRGVQGNRVLVLLDGIPLNSAMGGDVDLGAISTGRIAEIEVHKGLTPGEFGGNALGGVINLKSKTADGSRAVGSQVSLGAYGYKRYHIDASSPGNERLHLFGSAAYTGSENNWPYLDRGRTPYSLDDYQVKRVSNHQYNHFEGRLHSGIELDRGRTLSTGISYSTSEMGIPAKEGSVNRTAIHGRELLTLHSVLLNDNENERSVVQVTPRAGYVRWSTNTFWTSLDESMGTFHGTITSVPNGYGISQTDLHILNISCVTDLSLTDDFAIQVALHGKHSQIVTETVVTGFPQGDWPGSSQELTVSSDLNWSFPFGKRAVGLSVGGSLRGVRSSTEGGHNSAFEIEVSAGDTTEYPWSAQAGLHYRPKENFILFCNAARYSHVPGLRDKYGANGPIIPNPDLKEETGVTYEAGIRYSAETFFADLVAFSNTIENGIILLSHGNMSKPLNLGMTVASGIETSVWVRPSRFFQTELRATLQNVENRTRIYNYYGNKVPNEPVFSGLLRFTVSPHKTVDVIYWLDYKSGLYRDFANVWQRVPVSPDQLGMAFHNAVVSWKPAEWLQIDLSVINFNGKHLRYDDVLQAIESEYSWVLYPVNEWSITAGMSF